MRRRRLNLAVHDLPADLFPFTVCYYRGDVEIGRTTIAAPGVLKVPAYGPGTTVRFTYATGHWVQCDADGTTTEGHTTHPS